MMTLDGVMQAPGGPQEDTSDDFQYGGWSAPYEEEVGEQVLQNQLNQPADYLLGRKTFEIFAAYWPEHADSWPGINEGIKYVLSQTLHQSAWKNTIFIQHVEAIKQLKQSAGADLQVWGSSQLIKWLLTHDLVDELRLKIYPITLGQGKKWVDKGPIPAAFRLTDSLATPSGALIANYQRAGEVKTGRVGA
ncbi:dihydrofolate reductase family protein [Spirosoma flavus]